MEKEFKPEGAFGMITISVGTLNVPASVLLYGAEGIGKTTLASLFPKPLFMDVEDGSGRMDVARFNVASYASMTQAIVELTHDPQGYQTLVIDTADWADRYISEAVCARDGKRGIEDFGYGKGYSYLVEEWGRFLDSLTNLQKKTGMNVVFTAHATQRKVESVEEAVSYDHWELKMSKKAGPLLKEWADFVIFIRYQFNVVDVKNGSGKASGGKRILCTSHTATYDAKSRAKLPAVLDYNKEGVKTLMAAIFPETVNDSASTASAPSVVAPEKTSSPETTSAPTVLGNVDGDGDRMSFAGPNHSKLWAVMQERGLLSEEMRKVAAAKGSYPEDAPLENWSEEFCGRVVAGIDKIESYIKKTLR